MINTFVKASQFLSWFFLKPLFHLRFRIRIKGRHYINSVHGPLIIIANHISVYDSFLFRILPGFFTRLLPFRFMGVTKFHHNFLNFLTKIGVVPFIYSIFGVFVVTPGRGLEHGLKDAKRIIREGGIVVIFPEGRINKHGGILEFKRGAAALSITTGTPILPVAIKRVGQRFYSNVGQLIHLNPNSTFEDGTEILRTHIVELFENIK
jgi:1-acyl-sn-glycerol-3-phosphate acyltransferase